MAVIENARSLAAALESIFGDRGRIASRTGVAGGDINAAFRLELRGGETVFLKENRASLAPMFAAETAGLEALGGAGARSDAPPVPEPLAWGVEGSRAFLLMRAVPSGRPGPGFGEAFGRSLAALHRGSRESSCGFQGDNWIGSTEQPNPWTASWHEFFAEHRLLYQWRLARNRGYGDSVSERGMERLCLGLPDLLPDLDDGRACLLHGDLWGGNWMPGETGSGCRAWLIDPAVYFGHREADLAMTELFGGFPSGFRRGYEDAWHLEPGFDRRKDLYNLYHLLNHLNLFGPSYWSGVRRIIADYS